MFRVKIVTERFLFTNGSYSGVVRIWNSFTVVNDTGKACLTGVNDTGEAYFTGVVDNGEAYLAGIVDTGKKNITVTLAPVKLFQPWSATQAGVNDTGEAPK